MAEIRTISYYTEKGGVSPAVRTAVKEQALKMGRVDLSGFEKVGDYYILPVAKDFSTGETLYLKITASVGTKPTEKVSKKTEKSVNVPNIF